MHAITHGKTCVLKSEWECGSWKGMCGPGGHHNSCQDCSQPLVREVCVHQLRQMLLLSLHPCIPVVWNQLSAPFNPWATFTKGTFCCFLPIIKEKHISVAWETTVERIVGVFLCAAYILKNNWMYYPTKGTQQSINSSINRRQTIVK